MVCTRCELSSLDELTELWRPFIRFRMDWCVQHHRDQSWIWSVSQFIHTFNKWIMPRTGLMDSTIWKTHIFITGAWCAFWTPTLYQYLNSLFFYFFLRILCIHCFFTPNDNNKQWVCGAVYCLFLLLLVDAFRQYQLLVDPFEWTSVGTTVDVVCISTDTCFFPAYVATTFFWSYWFHLKKKNSRELHRLLWWRQPTFPFRSSLSRTVRWQQLTVFLPVVWFSVCSTYTLLFNQIRVWKKDCKN